MALLPFFQLLSAFLGKQRSLRQISSQKTSQSFSKEDELRFYVIEMLKGNCCLRSVWASNEHSDPKDTQLDYSTYSWKAVSLL